MAEQKAGWDETKAIWAKPDNRLFYKLLGAAVLVGIGVLVGRAIYAAPEADQAWGYGVNLFTGVISTAATVLILDQLAERRADRKAEEALKEQLKLDAASTSNPVAVNAVHQLWRRNWLRGENGLLQGADMTSARLQGATLMGANLRGANFTTTNLQGANIGRANLQAAILWNSYLPEAFLGGANLEGAYLNGANLAKTDLSTAILKDADFVKANLQETNLFDANLQGANLFEANLQGALLGIDLLPARFDESTILPDGQRWSSDLDMRRYTDPDYPGFWQPEWVKQQNEQA